jgi:hypothetical protein
MALDISVTENVTKVSVSGTSTNVTVSPQVTQIGVATTAISTSSASGISVTPTGEIEATNLQAALAEIGANKNFTTALNTKLGNIADSATNNTAGSNISITDGAISADVLGAISAGTGIAIDENGVISVSDMAIATVQTAASEVEHLALTTQQGDVVIRTDSNKSYIHNGGTAGTIADFTELATNTNGVLSINDETGAVTFGKADLSDYSANEFIDWTTDQGETNINPANYTDTTYSEGDNISISASGEISSTASGGTTYTAGTGIGIDESDVISWNSSTIQFDKIKLNLPDSQTNSGVFFESFDSDAYQNPVHGVNLYYDDPEDPNAQRVHIAAFTDISVSFTAPFSASELRVSDSLFVKEVPYTDPLWQGSRPLKLHDSCFIETPTDESVSLGDGETENDKLRIANTSYVHNTVDAALEALSSSVVPEPTPLVHHDRVLTYTDPAGLHWRTNRPTQLMASDNPVLGLDPNQVQLFNYQWETSNIEAGVKIEGGTGVTVSFDSTVSAGLITISANPDGLPDQDASLDGYVLTTDGQDADWIALGDVVLPVQEDNGGKFLKTDGTTADWEDVDAFPPQGGNGGKFLKTDGIETVTWSEVDALPLQTTSLAGKYLTTDGASASWTTAPSLLPDQTDNDNKYLVTIGGNPSWQTINTAGQTGNISFSGSNISSSDTDTVTIADKLTVDDDLSASKLVLTGSEQPKVVSNASYEITAPDGVTQNGMPLPTYQFYFYVNDGQTYTPTLPLFADVDITKNDDKSYTVEFTGGNGVFYDESRFFVMANFTSTSPLGSASSVDTSELLTNVIVREEGKGFTLMLVDKDGDPDGVKRGYVFVQVFDYL